MGRLRGPWPNRQIRGSDRAIDQSSVLLFLIAADAVGEWQEYEWRAGLRSIWERPQATILPVLIGKARPPAFLQSWQAMQWYPGRDDGEFFTKLVDIVRKPPPAGAAAPRPVSDVDRQRRFDEIARAAKDLQVQARESR